MNSKYIKKFQNIKNIVGKEDPIIVEIGAHYGEDSMRFLEIFNNPTLYCFEPDPRNIRIIRRYISDKIKLFPIAVFNKDNESITFYQSCSTNPSENFFTKYYWIDRNESIELHIGSSGASSLKKGHPLVKNAKEIKVKTIRLDTWARENNVNNIDFIWIDTQGSEKEVIEGFGYMKNNIKYIWIEYGELKYHGALNRKQTIDKLIKLGFSLLENYSCKNKKGDLLFERK